MEKIKILLAKLDNTVSRSLKKRLDAYSSLNEKLKLAEEEYEKDKSAENEADLNEIKAYILEVEEDLIEDLEIAVEEKEKTPEANPQEPEIKPTETEAKEKKDEEEGSMSILGIVAGGALLVLSLGAINYFSKK